MPKHNLLDVIMLAKTAVKEMPRRNKFSSWGVLTQNGVYHFSTRSTARNFAKVIRVHGHKVVGPDAKGARS